MISPPPPPGGGGYFHYWRWLGRAAGQGMIFTVINIDTGYLNNWLLAGYSVYHRVASRASHPTMFMTGPAISAPATVRAGRNRFRVFISFYCKTTIGQGISEVCNIATGYALWKFLVRYIVTGCIFCAPSGLRQGPVLNPPAAPPYPVESWVPPPPPPDAKLFIPLQFRTPVRTHLHTANQRPRVLICIQPIHRGWFNPRYKLVRPPLLPSTARGAVGKATCSTALHCLFSGCEFKSSCCLFFLL